jgi:hypothetical protein
VTVLLQEKPKEHHVEPRSRLPPFLMKILGLRKDYSLELRLHIEKHITRPHNLVIGGLTNSLLLKAVWCVLTLIQEAKNVAYSNILVDRASSRASHLNRNKRLGLGDRTVDRLLARVHSRSGFRLGMHDGTLLSDR